MRPAFHTSTRNNIFLDTIRKEDPDILVLTETNSCINPGLEYHSVSTIKLPVKFEGFDYAEGENRVTIYSKFPFKRHFTTIDEYTSVCSEIILPGKSLIVYGTIIGITGGKDSRFKEDFEQQKSDILKLAENNNICVAGDFNIAFSGYAYPSNNILKEADEFFQNVGLDIVTRNNISCPDHIAISKAFLRDISLEFSQIPFDPKVTDHSLVNVKFVP